MLARSRQGHDLNKHEKQVEAGIRNAPLQQQPPGDFYQALGMAPERRREYLQLSCKRARGGEAVVRKTEHRAPGRRPRLFEEMPEDEVQGGAETDCAQENPDEADRERARSERPRCKRGGHKLEPRIGGDAPRHHDVAYVKEVMMVRLRGEAQIVEAEPIVQADPIAGLEPPFDDRRESEGQAGADAERQRLRRRFRAKPWRLFAHRPDFRLIGLAISTGRQCYGSGDRVGRADRTARRKSAGRCAIPGFHQALGSEFAELRDYVARSQTSASTSSITTGLCEICLAGWIFIGSSSR